MAPQRPPSSPTSLLWAHQLKREHGFLLNRMKKLETEIAGVESRTKAAADTVGVGEIAAIAKKVQSLTDHGSHAIVQKIRDEVMGRFEDVGIEIEAVTIQISNLERSQESLKEDRRHAAESETALLMRINEVEASIKEYKRSVLKLGRKIDDQAISKIRDALTGLSEDVKSNKVAGETVNASLERLDEASKVLRAGNEKLAEQVKELVERPTYVPAPAVAPSTQYAAAVPITVLQEPEEESQDPPQASLPVKKPKANKKTAVKAAQEATRKPARKQPQSVKGVGMTDIKQETMFDERLQAPIVRRGRGWIEIVDHADVGLEEPEVNVISDLTKRRGRACKAAAPPAQSSSSANTTIPPKKGPSHPRANAAIEARATRRSILQSEEIGGTSPLETGTPSTSKPAVSKRRPRKETFTAAAPRRSIFQPDENQLPAKDVYSRHQPERDESQAISEESAGHGQNKVKAIDSTFDSLERPRKRPRRGLTTIFTSPMSSSVSPAIVDTIEPVPESSRPGHVYDSETSQPTSQTDKDTIRVQQPKRRTIVQLEDERV